MAFLQEWYGVASAEDVAAHMGVSVRAMKEQARRMGISARANRDKYGTPWCEVDREMPAMEYAA
jgi:hypothetical protein